MMNKRKKHPNKAIEEAVQYAKQNGWVFRSVGNSAHAWGRLLCPLHERAGCSMSIWSTPRNGDTHAKQIKRKVDVCKHRKREG